MINTTPKYLDIAQHNNTTTDLPLIPSPNTILETRPRVAKLLLSRTYPSNQAASSKQRTEQQQREKSASILPLYPSRPPCSSSGNPSGTVRLAVPCANSLAALSSGPQPLSRSHARTHSRAVCIVPLQTTPIRAPQLRTRRERRAIPRNIVIFRHFLIYGAAR